MFEPNDEERLIRLLSNNNVILFLGAGFSYDTINKLGENFPMGENLSKKIWEFISLPGDYDGTPLQEMYKAFLNSGIKHDKVKNFLEDNLTVSSLPDIYSQVTKPFWYKIYTLNIDNVLDVAYKRAGKEIQNLKFPKDDFAERDQSLEKLQIIYLNGKLPANPNDLIFSSTQYAKASLTHQPLYAQFVYDYAVKTVIFLGTEINEPLFENYLAAREGKHGKENRPRSYLIKPTLSPVKALNYKADYNVTHIPGTTNDFLKWLEKISVLLLPKAEILKSTFPNLIRVLSDAADSDQDTSDLRIFAQSFNKIPQDYRIIQERSGFLRGASPTWNDIFRELDIPRTFTNKLIEKVHEVLTSNVQKLTIIAVFGTAGSGKSTILKRIGLRLTQEGHYVYISYSEFMIRASEVFNALRIIDKKVIICFDNAENMIFAIPKLITELNQLKYPPILIFSSRTSSNNKINNIIDSDVDYIPLDLPDLDDKEIGELIDKLEANNLLGVLKGLNSSQRFNAFKHSAKKQILIALKEATSGELFEDIIKDEFEKIDPFEAQILAICISLNTELGFANSKQDFVGFSKVIHSEALDYLANSLKGTILHVGPSNNEKIMIRHRVVAEYFIKHCATLQMLKEAYVRVLSILAPELKKTQGSSRKFNLYKKLINHQLLYERFEQNIDQAREVYDSISTFFNDDFHYWLQYGCLELEGTKGNMDLAENYINQAESLNNNNIWVLNAKCVLYYKKALVQQINTKAFEYKQLGDEMSNYLLEYGEDNPYIYHIYCRGRYQYMKNWTENMSEKKEELKHLLYVITIGVKNHPLDWRLKKVQEELTKAQLHFAVSESPIEINVFRSGVL